MKLNKYVILLIIFVAALIAMFLIFKPSLSNTPAKQYNIYVVYSPTCPHCKNLFEFLEKGGIGVHKLTIDIFSITPVYRELAIFFTGVPFIFAKVNNTYVIIQGYPSSNQEKDGYFMGRDFEENLCKSMNATPVYENGTYLFCRITPNILFGNRYAVLWLVEQCDRYGCEKILPDI